MSNETNLKDALSKVLAGGVFHFEHVRNGEVIDQWDEGNIVVNEGLDHLLDVTLSNATQNSTWYIGIYSGNYTPLAADTAADIASNSTEISTAVDETTRQVWTEAGVTSQSITNSASPAEFTANTTVNVYGAFLVSTSTMNGTSGVLMAAAKFAAVRALLNTDVLRVTYTLSIADA